MKERRLRPALNDLAHTTKAEDRDTAWRLVTDDPAAVDVDDDGEVDADRLGEIVAHVTKCYPYLVGDDEDEHTPAGRRDRPSVKPAGRRTATKAVDANAIARRFPALDGER